MPYFFFQLPEPMIAKSTFKNFDTQLIFGPRSKRECDCVKKHGRFMKSRNTKEILKFVYFVSKIVLTYCEQKKILVKILRSLQQFIQIVFKLYMIYFEVQDGELKLTSKFKKK